MSGNKHLTHPNIWRWQVVWVLHRNAGGGTVGAQNIILMTRMKDKLTPINLKIWAS